MPTYNEDLESSDWEEDWIADLYHRYFPNLVKIELVKKSFLQYSGIDKIFYLNNSEQIFIDEKVRFRDYGDILLEEYSNWELKTPSWLTDENKLTDFIAYIIVPNKKFWLLDFKKLQELWKINYKLWLDQYGRKFGKTENKRGETIKETSNIPVPIDKLVMAIKEIPDRQKRLF